MNVVSIMIVVNWGCFLIVRLKDRLEGCFHTKILSIRKESQNHNVISEVIIYALVTYISKRKIFHFSLSEYFVVSFPGIIFVHIKRTIKKHPQFTTIIIDTTFITYPHPLFRYP